MSIESIITKKAVLDNLIPVTLLQKPGAPMHVVITFNAGNAYIKDTSKHGLSHFIEHLLVSGSENYPTKDLLASYFDTFGATVGAMTNRDTVSIWMSYPDNLDSLVIFNELFSIISTPSVQLARMEHERQIIDSEIKRSKSKIDAALYATYLETIYKGTIYETEVLGTLESLHGFTAEDILWWNETFIHSGNCEISLIGDFDEEKILKSANATFGKLPIKEAVPLQKFTKPEYCSESYVEQVLPEVQLRYGFVFDQSENKLTKKDNVALLLLNSILSKARSGLLSKRFREELKMVYGISSAVRTPKLATEFNIITGVQHENLDLFITEVKDFILKLDSTITEDMVEQEKKRIIKTLPIKYQTSSDYYNLMDLCQKIGLTPLEYAEIHNSITLSDVQTVITYLKQADWVLARSK